MPRPAAARHHPTRAHLAARANGRPAPPAGRVEHRARAHDLMRSAASRLPAPLFQARNLMPGPLGCGAASSPNATRRLNQYLMPGAPPRPSGRLARAAAPPRRCIQSISRIGVRCDRGLTRSRQTRSNVGQHAHRVSLSRAPAPCDHVRVAGALRGRSVARGRVVPVRLTRRGRRGDHAGIRGRGRCPQGDPPGAAAPVGSGPTMPARPPVGGPQD